ncbi:MAG: 23S rRNA (cytidine2498-2'-O)-methyltransferase [Kiritimatiellia bacterium]|jgi:23S rRNA (cytidine2498-2'-O)-methyltransferase
MTSPLTSDFIFALTNPGSEKALKLEVDVEKLDWRSSYQRKGFVTFKRGAAFTLDDLDAPLACTRRLCLSLGKARTRDEAAQLVTAQLEHPLVHHARYQLGKMEALPGDQPARPKTGQLVGTVVELSPEEFWAGVHRHGHLTSTDPAGDPGLVMPEEAPSRAWLKMEEAIRFFNLTFKAEDKAVELGCAPGGVVMALLKRGVSVVGVDPAKMSKVLTPFTITDRWHPPAKQAWFYHCRKPAALAGKSDLGQDLTWFMSDMNQSPEVVLKECARFCRMAPTIRGLLVTLKLTNPEDVTEKSTWLAAVAKMGFKTIRLQQLGAHHRELVLFAKR